MTERLADYIIRYSSSGPPAARLRQGLA
jgi:hypothetical protein